MPSSGINPLPCRLIPCKQHRDVDVGDRVLHDSRGHRGEGGGRQDAQGGTHGR